MAKRKKVTIKRLTDAAEVISDLYHANKERTAKCKVKNFCDMTDYDMDNLRKQSLYQVIRIELFEELRMLYLMRGIEKRNKK